MLANANACNERDINRTLISLIWLYLNDISQLSYDLIEDKLQLLEGYIVDSKENTEQILRSGAYHYYKMLQAQQVDTKALAKALKHFIHMFGAMEDVFAPADIAANWKLPLMMMLLQYALVRGVSDAMQALIEVGVQPNFTDLNGDTPLIYAAKLGYRDLILSVIAAGATIDAVNSSGDSALSIASMRGHADAVSILLDHNANIELLNAQGSTPLHLAVHEGHEEVVHILLERRADANAQDGMSNTPLMLASKKGFMAIVADLLVHGADLNATSFYEMPGDMWGDLSGSDDEDDENDIFGSGRDQYDEEEDDVPVNGEEYYYAHDDSDDEAVEGEEEYKDMDDDDDPHPE